MAEQRSKEQNCKEEKQLMRRLLKEKRLAIPTYERKKRNESICKKILQLKEFISADTVLLYAPIEKNAEVDILELVKDCLCLGKRIAFPRCKEEDGIMSFHFVSSEKELVQGKYSIREPLADKPEFCPSQEDGTCSVCFVPALAFDKKGYRIGYGKGYYDRFLSTFKGTAVGVTYFDFLTDDLPVDEHDCAVQIIVTEKDVVITDEGEGEK